MKPLNKQTLLAATLAVLGTGQALAQAPQPILGYWIDSSSRIVKNGWGECWRTGSWTPALALPECEGGGVAPKAAAQPEPPPQAKAAAPAPAPAPVAAPAPAVAPAAVPAARPAETFRTQITEKAVRLEGANFATGSSRLLPGAGSKLDEVVEAARQYPEINLAVTGYTDNQGKADANVRLSQARAEAVKAYLVGKGVAAARISTAGRGAADPVADNASADGRAKNRRVEIRYVVKEETRVRVQ